VSRVDFSGSLVDGWFLPDPKVRKSDVEFNVDKLFISPQDEIAIQRGCYFDEAAAKRVLRFFEKYLKHSKGRWAGKPFKLLDWQRYDILAPLLGWKRPDGTRRFRIAYIEIPKKMGNQHYLPESLFIFLWQMGSVARRFTPPPLTGIRLK